MTVARWLTLAAFTAWLAAMPAVSAEESFESIAGQLLVATDEMPDPRFAETVIYMIGHDQEGAMGVVLNHGMETMPMANILRGFGEETPQAEGERRLHLGGPVYSNSGFVLHSADYTSEGTIVVDGDIAFTPGIRPLVDSVDGAGPARALLFLGISSWGPGQLESELQRTTGWTVVPADPAFVFDDDLESKWTRALSRRGIDL
jgi:putative transcriptional regulator